MITEDTIAGISTAVGQSGISVVRLSGPEAFKIADLVFKSKEKVMDQPSHTVRYGKIYLDNGDLLDEVLLIKMAAPRSYTRENVVEISCHGGYTIARALLDLLYQKGARPAEPGEFTKRAFINGRIDLTQAEAVMDVIQARTERVSKVAVRQLEGVLSEKINQMREKLIMLLSSIEVNLDYPEYDAEEVTLTQAQDETVIIIEDLNRLIESFGYGKVLREGMEVVIAGRPNVGKSSLMNRLARKNKSIVTDIPGTTRDVVEEYVNIKGIPVKLMDTAGVHVTEDYVEKLGVERSLKAIEGADFVIVLEDAARPSESLDPTVKEKIAAYKKPFVHVFNKIDLMNDQELSSLKEKNPQALFLSVSEDTGIDVLEEKLFAFASKNQQDLDNQVLITNTRHELQLKKAREHLNSALQAISSGLTLDMVALDLKGALEELGRITGHHADEDVVHAIFSRFCLGK